MAWKADNTQNALSIAVHGITNIDGGALVADLQGFELVTTVGDVATRVGIASPLPTRLYDGASQPLGTGVNPLSTLRSDAYVDDNGVIAPVLSTWKDVASGQPNQQLVAADATRHIRVLAIEILCGAAATVVQLRSGSVPTAIGPQWQFGSNGGIAIARRKNIAQTAINEALGVTTSGSGVSTSITVEYALVT